MNHPTPWPIARRSLFDAIPRTVTRIISRNPGTGCTTARMRAESRASVRKLPSYPQEVMGEAMGLLTNIEQKHRKAGTLPTFLIRKHLLMDECCRQVLKVRAVA